MTLPCLGHKKHHSLEDPQGMHQDLACVFLTRAPGGDCLASQGKVLIHSALRALDFLLVCIS